MKRTDATPIRNAHDPIMMGNATLGLMPSMATRIMHGAYNGLQFVAYLAATQLPAK